MTDFRLVDPAADDSLAALVADSVRIGVDTEFMREKTYFAELCLLQVATPNAIVCADPLGSAPPEAFWQALVEPEWVLHSARQDIEVVFHTAGLMPRTIFDTQVAAALLGFKPQTGYAGLVKALFGIELDKAHTRADWSKRPLADAVLEYAAIDVQYLLPAYDELVGRLERAGRLDWAKEDSADLLNPALYTTDPSQAIHRLKGARNLHGRARAAAAALAAWREEQALRTNRPRQWIMRDKVVVEIALRCPETVAELAAIDGIQAKMMRRAGQRLLQLVTAATHDPSGYRPPPRSDEQQKSIFRKMQHRVASLAGELGIAAELIAPRKELLAAMQGDREARIFRGWRRALVGEELLQLLEIG